MKKIFQKNKSLFFIFTAVIFLAAGSLLYIKIPLLVLISCVIVINLLFIFFIFYVAKQNKLKSIIEKLGYSSRDHFIKEKVYPRISVAPLLLMFIAYNVPQAISKIFFYVGFIFSIFLLSIFVNNLRNKSYNKSYSIVLYMVFSFAGLVLNFLGLALRK